MKRALASLLTILLFCLSLGRLAWGDSPSASPADDREMIYAGEFFQMDELEELLAPIALYPDPLIAQILPAATFVDQINVAARRVRMLGEDALIDQQAWDLSVKAIAHYPDLLFMMDQDQEWTISLGQAFINQPEDVMQAIQFLRRQAWEAGTLVSTPQQQVIVEKESIRILPAQPDRLYLPQYDPREVFEEPPAPPYGLISFSIAFIIGPWLNRDCDWHAHRIYYHGWQGSGWIQRARPHIRTFDSIYINRRYTTIQINRRVIGYDTGAYRTRLRRGIRSRNERPVATPRNIPRIEQRRPQQLQPSRQQRVVPSVQQPVQIIEDQPKRRLPSSPLPGGRSRVPGISSQPHRTVTPSRRYDTGVTNGSPARRTQITPTRKEPSHDTPPIRHLPPPQKGNSPTQPQTSLPPAQPPTRGRQPGAGSGAAPAPQGKNNVSPATGVQRRQAPSPKQRSDSPAPPHRPETVQRPADPGTGEPPAKRSDQQLPRRNPSSSSK